MLRTNNPLERIMRKIRHRTRVVRFGHSLEPMAIMPSLPDGKSCLNLAAARLRHIEGPQWPTRKYTNMTPLLAHQTQEAVVA